jgi:hypothetical protein
MKKYAPSLKTGKYADIERMCWLYGEAQTYIEGDHKCPRCKQPITGIRRSDSYVFVAPHSAVPE